MAKIHITAHADGTATIITNDESHAAHGPDNPDDGSTSQFALDLAAELGKYGIETEVSRLD